MSTKELFKSYFKSKKGKCFIIIAPIIIVIVLAINIVVFNPQIEGVIDMVLGGQRPIYGSNADITEFVSNASNKEEALANGNEMCITLEEEGSVLLKNNNALPLAKNSKVSVFGKNSVNIVLGGSGSAGNSAGNGTILGIYDSLKEAGFETNEALYNFYNSSASGSGRPANPAMEGSLDATLAIGETDYSSYTDTVKSSYSDYNDAALVVISRIGGEGFDLPRVQDGEDDPSRHYLELSPKEETLIDEIIATNTFKHIILVINSANPIELGFLENNDKIDGAIWIGLPGAQGIMALGELLNGDVNPSGHLVDTYASDFTASPVYQNFGTNNNGTTGDRFIVGTKTKASAFVDYEEEIYVGYRYYETRGSIEGEEWYKNNVVYPFGYGLSYTSFETTVSSVPTSFNANEEFVVTVNVKNTGLVAGKEVVQLYMGAPYTTGGIEKPSKVLVGFKKTSLLEAGESEDLEITIDPYYFASYDYDDKNSNGFTGYELEAGSYSLYVSKNAHEVIDTKTMTLGSDYQFENDPLTGTKVENQFSEAGVHLQTQMSRSDFAGTFPVSPSEEDRTVSENFYSLITDVTPYGNHVLTDTDLKMPEQGVNYGADQVYLSSLIGKDFDDPLWEQLLNEISISDLIELMSHAAFRTANISSIKKSETIDPDGPIGFVNFMGGTHVYDTCKYCCEPIVGATWNVDLLEQYGETVGDEALVGDANEGTPYSGWYAPGLNTHRGEFGGRNCEYFSEDPFLAGMMAAHEVIGAQSKGVTTYIKHFAVNEQETNRALNGNATFLSEQALREIYLKPFEYAVKFGKTRGIMTSFTRIGTRWCGGSYELLTNVLRGEWGFHGSVVTDFNTQPSYMNTKLMAYSGGTLNLTGQTFISLDSVRNGWTVDASDAKDITVLREAAHETLYAVANSNSRVADGYKMAIWKEIVIISDVAIGVITIAWFGLTLFFTGKKIKDDAENATVDLVREEQIN